VSTERPDAIAVLYWLQDEAQRIAESGSPSVSVLPLLRALHGEAVESLNGTLPAKRKSAADWLAVARAKPPQPVAEASRTFGPISRPDEDERRC